MRMPRATLPRAALVVVAVLLASVLDVHPGTSPTPVGASSRGGASSSVVGRGDILTSIVRWGGSSGRRASTSRCWWRTLTDAHLEFLIALSAAASVGELDLPELASFQGLLLDGEPGESDFQVRICGARVDSFRSIPRATPAAGAQVLSRRMITRLPPPQPVVSPAPEVVVPVGFPVIWSVPAEDWRPVTGSITVDGISAEVHAEPVELRVVTGDPALGTVRCAGPGLPFDPRDVPSEGETTQRCSASYLTTTSPGSDGPSGGSDRRDSPPRPGAWIGTVTVVWSARWRTGDGPWRNLGLIPRTTVFTRSVRELTTSIESLRSSRP